MTAVPFVLKNCRVEINSVDFSAWCSSVEVALSKDSVDVTSFNGSGRTAIAGLKQEKFTINLQQDFNAAAVDQTLYPLYANETNFTVKVRPTQSAISTTNPEFSATVILLEYSPLSGKPGDLSDTSITFPCQAAGISRATS